MAACEPHPISRAIDASRAGDEQAASRLLPLLYEELRQVARILLAKKPPGQTLQATALVHEAYLRVAGKERRWEGRGDFFQAAAGAMRDILVEQARRKAALKRGGGWKKVPLDDVDLAMEPPSEDVLALDEALKKLERLDARKARIVMLRYFSGLTVPEIAELLGLSAATVEREWRYIRAWLSRELSAGSPA